MNQAAEVINLDEFRKRRDTRPEATRTSSSAPLWSPVWVCWVMVWPR